MKDKSELVERIQQEFTIAEDLTRSISTSTFNMQQALMDGDIMEYLHCISQQKLDFNTLVHHQRTIERKLKYFSDDEIENYGFNNKITEIETQLSIILNPNGIPQQ